MKYFFLSIFLLLTLSTCKRENDNAITEQPKDYLTCRINGQVYEAGCDALFNNCLSSRLEENESWLYIIGNAKKSGMTIILHDSTGIKEGVNNLINPYISGNCARYRDNTSHYYDTDSINTGEVTIKFNEQKDRITGTFSFKGKYNSTNEIVTVTDGKFSITLNNYN